jgi:proteasome lid subunit RPN8/RPN11
MLSTTYDLATEPQENVVAAYLDTRDRIIATERVYRGTIDHTITSTRDVLRSALLLNAHSIVIAHNHPSGDTKPSDADIQFTINLAKACELLHLHLSDHLIIAGTKHASLARYLPPQAHAQASTRDSALPDWRKRLRDAIYDTGRKQQAIAWDAGVAPQTLSRVLHSVGPLPAFETIVRITHATGETVGWLLDEPGYGNLTDRQRHVLRSAAATILRMLPDEREPE